MGRAEGWSDYLLRALYKLTGKKPPPDPRCCRGQCWHLRDNNAQFSGCGRNCEANCRRVTNYNCEIKAKKDKVDEQKAKAKLKNTERTEKAYQLTARKEIDTKESGVKKEKKSKELSVKKETASKRKEQTDKRNE